VIGNVKKKLVVILALVSTVSILVGYFALDYFVLWPTVQVDATDVNPYSGPFSILGIKIFENENLIGESGQLLRLSPGKHILTFSDYKSGYETPQAVTVDLTQSERKTISVEYVADFGYLSIETSAFDAYSEKRTEPDVQIFVDGEPKGVNKVGLEFRGNSLGTHTVSFAPLEGYTAPSVRTIEVTKGKATWVKEDYQKILSNEESRYVMIRDQVKELSASYSQDFNQGGVLQLGFWVLKNRVSVPFYYVSFNYPATSRGSSLSFDIYQYAGLTLDERIDVCGKIFDKLEILGINNSTYKVAASSVKLENLPEYAVRVRVEFDLYSLPSGAKTITWWQEIENSQSGILWQYSMDQSRAIPNMFPSFIPGGFTFTITTSGNAKLVYVNILGQNRPITEVYSKFSVSNYGIYSYEAYKELSLSAAVNYYTSNSLSQLSNLIESSKMMVAIVNLHDFLESLRWYT
jgi:hypothetical protein